MSVAAARAKVVALDVLETLFSLEPMRARIEGLGLPGHALETWFAQLLREGFALAAMGSFAPFQDVAAGTLKALVAASGGAAGSTEIKEALKGLRELPAHPDVREGLERIRANGVRAIALTNGSARNTRALLRSAGLDHLVEEAISIEEVALWKPRKEVYVHAARRSGVRAAEMALIAAHPWDVAGAKAAGLSTGWVMRKEKAWPAYLKEKPDAKSGTVGGAVGSLVG